MFRPRPGSHAARAVVKLPLQHVAFVHHGDDPQGFRALTPRARHRAGHAASRLKAGAPGRRSVAPLSSAGAIGARARLDASQWDV